MGGLPGGALLIFFIAYLGIRYSALRGQDCNCFPWVKRAVGPGFFIGDLLMLALAAVAGCGQAILLFPLRRRGAVGRRGVRRGLLRVNASCKVPSMRRAPSKSTADRFRCVRGRVFLFLYNPECNALRRCCPHHVEVELEERRQNRRRRAPRVSRQFARALPPQRRPARAPVSSDVEALRKRLPLRLDP